MDVAASATAEATASKRNSTDEQTNGQPENKFTKAIKAWRNIDLTNLIPSLDTTASDLVTGQRDALVERKDLAQKTKDFRKLEDQAKLVEIKSLLKSYQSYIDLVSNQNKAVSSAFLGIYSSLSEAPDPYPLLDASIESLIVADERLPQLEDENQQLRSANAKLTAQLEDTERSLQDERKARQDVEAATDSRVQEVESSWSAVLAEKQDNWDAREKSLEERVSNQDRLLKELKASYEVSQRLDRSDEDAQAGLGGASAAELEIVTSDLERANARLAEVESRNEQLRVQLAQSATQDASRKVPVEEDAAYLRLRSENTILLRKAESIKLDREAEQRKWDTSTKASKRELDALRADTESLRNKLKKWSDYEDLKRELEIMKSIEFAVGDTDDPDSRQATAGSESKSEAENLEHLLLARNKKLNDELTVLRVSQRDLSARLETLQDDLSNANIELDRSRSLNATLENDLSRMQEEATSAAPAMSVAGYSSRYPGSNRRGRAASPTSSIISGFDSTRQSPSTLESLRAGEAVGGGSGMMPMIIAQRDRFKKRIADLEAELSKSYQTVTSLRSEVGALQKDNLNLYEKSRYQASYAGGNPNDTTIQINDTQPLDKYSSAYESRISPFASFNKRESQRSYKQMMLPEKAIFQVTQFVLATRPRRNIFAMYVVFLHVLILMLGWPSGQHYSGQVAANLADAAMQQPAAAAAMVDAAGS